MSRRIPGEAFETLTLFVKISLAFGAAALLFLDDRSVAAISSSSQPLSLVSELCLGATFVATVILVAVWDVALAILVCLFLVCWIAALQKQKQKHDSQRQRQRQKQDPSQSTTTPQQLRAASEYMAKMQAQAIDTQAAHDNAGPALYSLDTPLPTVNDQTSIPMAYTMADRTYSTTAACLS